MLTPKQEKFVLGLVEGKSQRKAYEEAFDCTRMKEKTIDEKASRLFSTDKVRARYKEIIEQSKEIALWNRERALKELITMLDDSKLDKNYNARYNAIKELNALCKLYDEDISITDPKKLSEILRKLSAEKLEKILDEL
jgi:hypothetical protein